MSKRNVEMKKETFKHKIQKTNKSKSFEGYFMSLYHYDDDHPFGDASKRRAWRFIVWTCSLEMLVRVVKTKRFKLKCAQFMDELAKTSCGNKLSFHSLCFEVKKRKERKD